MGLRIILSLILFQIVTFVSSQPIISVPDFLLVYCLYDTGNYTNGSDYKANLDHVLAEIPTGDGNGYGFYNLSYGGDGRSGDIDKVHAIGQCRGDVEQDFCRDCLQNATIRVLQVCPGQKDAGGWYEGCMLRYSNRSMAGGAAPHPTKLYVNNGQSASDREGFNQDLGELLNNLKGRAAGGGVLRKYATGNRLTSGFKSIYALVQCTADLSEADCNNCLDDAFGDIPGCCNGTTGGRVIKSNCNFRFDDQLFYEQEMFITLPVSPPALAPKMSSSPRPPRDGNTKSRVIIISVTSVVTSLLLLIMVVFTVKVRMTAKNVETHHSYEPAEETETSTSLQINFEILRVATDDFSDENKLGQGGFGLVYKGRLSNGKHIAIKRLSKGSHQGDIEFKNEVTLVSKLQHRNLVKILGFCLEGSERLLVYELVPNGSLDRFIFDPVKRVTLDWNRRYKIIGGIARGLLYLHEDSRLRIIHRDMKTSNILLDEELIPKIADFGMAKLFMVDQTRDNTNRVVGTYGYMAPEYIIHGHYSMKSDVFSLGVLLLEIVSGQKNSSFHIGDHVGGILSSTWKNWTDGTISNVVDPVVRNGPGSEILRVVHIALLCAQENAAKRPTMATVVLMLNSDSMSLPVPSKPAFLFHSNPVGSDSPLDFDSEGTRPAHKTLVSASVNEISSSEFYPR